MICEGRQFEPGREQGFFFLLLFQKIFFFFLLVQNIPWSYLGERRKKKKKKKQVPVTCIKRPNSYLGVLETFSEKSILNQGDF